MIKYIHIVKDNRCPTLNPGKSKKMIEASKFLCDLEDKLWEEIDDNYYEPGPWHIVEDYLLFHGNDRKLLINVIKLCEKGYRKSKLDCYREYYTDLIKSVSERISTLVESSLL